MTDVMTRPYMFVLPSGETATVDADDRDLVEAEGPWCALRDSNTTYVRAHRRRPDGTRTTISLHRLLLDPPDDMCIDHINRNGLDNRRGNLRVCTQSQNNANSPPRPGYTSKYKGVSWYKRDAKWHAQSRDNSGKILLLGRFTYEDDAARAYDVHAIATWPGYAWLNVDNFEELSW